MKILMMTNTYAPIVGGLEKSIQIFSDAFRARGHQVKIVAPEFQNMPKNEKDIIRVPALEKVIGTDFSISLPLPEVISKLVEEFSPDIVHSHHPFVMGDLALRLCGQKKIPLVFTYHTMFEHYTDHFGMDRQSVQRFVVELATGYANMADQVIVPSESVQKVLLERKVSTPIAVVPTGIDMKRFAPAPSPFRRKHKIPEKAFLAGHTGRLAPEKNLPFLTEAAAEFLKKNKNAYFLVVGSGPSEREMRKIFRAWKVEKRAVFAGVLRGKALAEAYHAMDVFAFASKSETQGIVIAEAMAAGLPVVGLDAPGVREVVRDRVNGRLLAVESRAKFSSALGWCARQSASRWNRVKKEALKTAEEFSIHASADKALAVYEKVQKRQEPSDVDRFQGILGRFKTELNMLFNFSRAAGSALVKAAVTETPLKERVGRVYQKKIEIARNKWMLELKKMRRELNSASGESKTALESAIETVSQKIRVYETELTEINRQIVAACEVFEKKLEEAGTQLKKQRENGEAEPKKPEEISAENKEET